jgi:hypothetical protein
MVDSKGATGSCEMSIHLLQTYKETEVSFISFLLSGYPLSLHGVNSLLGVATYCLYLLPDEIEVSCVFAAALVVAFSYNGAAARHRRQQ